MINHVRNTVLTVLNKENRVFITPAQFNSYAKHAQQLLFNQYLSEYSRMLTAKNARQISSEFMDREEILMKRLQAFTKQSSVAQSLSKYDKPSDLQYIIAVRHSNTDIEQVPRHKERFLISSNLTSPSNTYPVFIDEGSTISVFPTTITGNVDFTYVRNPKDPKWTYNLIGENPVFNSSKSDYQDFEIDQDESVNLIVEILKLTGLTIRETEVTQVASGLDQANTNKDS